MEAFASRQANTKFRTLPTPVRGLILIVVNIVAANSHLRFFPFVTKLHGIELFRNRLQVTSRLGDKNCVKTPLPPLADKAKPVATINKQSMGYFIVKDIESATSYLKREWIIFALKELLDNAYDWLDDYYPGDKARR